MDVDSGGSTIQATTHVQQTLLNKWVIWGFLWPSGLRPWVNGGEKEREGTPLVLNNLGAVHAVCWVQKPIVLRNTAVGRHWRGALCFTMGGFLSKGNCDVSRALELAPMYNGGGEVGALIPDIVVGFPKKLSVLGGTSKEEFQRKWEHLCTK